MKPMSPEAGPALDRRFLAPDHSTLAWDGLAALSGRGGWWEPWRITPDRPATALSPALLDRAATPAGARLRLRTDAEELTLRIAVGGAAPVRSTSSSTMLPVRLPVTPGVHDLRVPLPGRPVRVEMRLPQARVLRSAPADLITVGLAEIVGQLSVGQAWGSAVRARGDRM
ncbi:hypothetical protein ACWEKM_08480 [Streptomyces sp. NPDC004752]